MVWIVCCYMAYSLTPPFGSEFLSILFNVVNRFGVGMWVKEEVCAIWCRGGAQQLKLLRLLTSSG